MNAENDGDWNHSPLSGVSAYDFDVGNADSDGADIYSQSLLATEEDVPPSHFYPRGIGVRKASRNSGTVNCFNIGIAGSARVSFTDYAPHVFRYLRTKIYKVSDRSYLESILPPAIGGEINITKISDEIIAKFSEGRSGAFFFFTPDNRYLIKTLNRTEAQLLIDTLEEYVHYMEKHKNETFLTKYYGLHSVRLYSKVFYFMVSGNVFPADKQRSDKIKERYDLKGSWIARHTNRHLFENKLMKDEDLHRNLRLDPMEQKRIHSQLAEDTKFLAGHNIMDYSLLLGVSYDEITGKDKRKPMRMAHPYQFHIDENQEQDYVDINDGLSSSFNGRASGGYDNYTVNANVVEGPGTYYIGIIDMLQEWNTQKKMEKFWKVYLRCQSRAGISCVEPTFYRKRFLKKMSKIGM